MDKTNNQTMDEVRWGIIGCGDVAEHKGGPALYNVPHSRLVAVMSRRAHRAEDFARRHNAGRFYTDVDDLLADAEVNAVYIATPPNVHAGLTERAARAGKHVLCEKPMAMTVAECRRMVQTCHDHDVQLIIAYYRRFFPVVEKMKEALAEGVIGRPLRARTAVANYYTPRADGERGWLTQQGTAGGGFLTDVATHRLDLLAHFLGTVRTVAALVETQHFDFAVDDASSLVMHFENGAHAMGSFNWNVDASVDEFEVWGTRGRLLARNLGAGELEIHAGGTVAHHHLPAPSITHLGLVDHFVQCLRAGRPNDLPGEEGMQATRMTEAAYQSAREGRVISVD